MEIFVFGSNLLGIHGAGSAKTAYLKHGAVRGIGVGPAGNSYAIPTKHNPRTTMTISEIAPYVDQFKKYAADHPELSFKLVAIGCGLAGFHPRQIAPLFDGAPSNVIMPQEFMGLLVLGGIATADIVNREDGTQGPSIEHTFWMRP